MAGSALTVISLSDVADYRGKLPGRCTDGSPINSARSGGRHPAYGRRFRGERRFPGSTL